MRAGEKLRETFRREMRRAMGTDPRMPRLHSAQVTGALTEAELLALPVETEGAEAVWEVGAFPFMVGYSALGGPDPLD